MGEEEEEKEEEKAEKEDKEEKDEKDLGKSPLTITTYSGSLHLASSWAPCCHCEGRNTTILDSH